MGASASVLSGSDVDEAEARKWAMKENVPFDEIAFRRIQNNENISEQRLKQLLPPKIPKWDHVALCLRGEHVACQQEDGEPLCALSYTNTNFNITDEHMANICPESGCEDRVFELQGTNNIIKFSNPHSLSSTYTIACWFKPSNMLWKTKSTNLGGGSINDDDGVVGYKLISDQEHQSSLISLIHKENDVYIGLCLENQSYIIPTQTKTKLIPNKWQLIVMTCENKNTNSKNLEYYLAVDGQGPKNNGYIDMDTKQSNMMAQRIDYVGDMNNDIGFLSSLYIWDHKLDFQEIYKIFIAETWRFGIDLKLYKNSILDRAKYLMSKLSHVFIGGINPDENGTQQPNEHKPVEQIEEGETKKDGNGNNNEKEEEENYLEFQNLSLFKMIQNLSKWKKTETISQTSSSFDVHSQQKVAQEKEEKEEETEVADFSNVDLLDEELKALLLILPSMRHITAISFSNNDALSLNSLGNPLLEFLAEDVPMNVTRIALCRLNFISCDNDDGVVGNIEQLLLDATEDLRSIRGVSIDVSGAQGISEATLQLLANQGEEAQKAKQTMKEEMELSEKQVDAYEALQARLGLMWSNLEDGILPQPMNALPGNLAVIPMNLINPNQEQGEEGEEYSLTMSPSEEDTIILNSDIVKLIELFEQDLEEGYAKAYQKKGKKVKKKKKTKRTTPIMSENEEKYFKTYIKDFLLKRGTLLNLDVDILKPNHRSQSTPSEPPSSASSNTTSKEKRNEEIMKELETFIQKNNNNSASKVNIEEVFDTLFAFMKWHEDKLIELEEKRVYALHEVLASRYIEAYPITDSIITEIANNPNSPPPKEIAEQFHQFVEKEAPNLAEVSTTNLKSELCQYPSEKIVWKCLENTQRQKVIAEKKRLRKQNMKKLRSFSISEYDGADPKPLFRNHQGSGMIIAHFSFLSGHNAGLLDPTVFGLSKKGEEQDGEDTKNDSNKRQSILSLHEAVEQKKAIIKEVTGHGFGSNALHITLKGMSSSDIELKIKKGTIFEHKNWAHKQNLLVISSTTITLSKNQVSTYKLDAHCMNLSCRCSSGQNMLLSNWMFCKKNATTSQGKIWDWFESAFRKGKTLRSKRIPSNLLDQDNGDDDDDQDNQDKDVTEAVSGEEKGDS